MPHLTHQVETADGPIFHLEISRREFLSIDIRRAKDVFSWTAKCTASEFLLLGAGKDGKVSAAIDGAHLTGESSEILSQLTQIPKGILDEQCDFVRFDWTDLSLMFQIFSKWEGESEDQIHLVTAVGQGMQLPKIHTFISKTATEAVINEVDEHLAVTTLLGQQSAPATEEE